MSTDANTPRPLYILLLLTYVTFLTEYILSQYYIVFIIYNLASKLILCNCTIAIPNRRLIMCEAWPSAEVAVALRCNQQMEMRQCVKDKLEAFFASNNLSVAPYGAIVGALQVEYYLPDLTVIF